MNARSMGMAMVVLGVVFLGISSRPGRASLIGLAAGELFMIAGFVRIVRSGRGGPPRP